MNYDQSPVDELYGAMRSALRAEPPMTALPHDDLLRGQSRLRRRRLGTAASVAAVVPVVALIVTVVPSGPAAGPDGPGFANSPTADRQTFDVECGGVLAGELRPQARGSDAPRELIGSDRVKLKRLRPGESGAPRELAGGGGPLQALKRDGSPRSGILGTVEDAGEGESHCEAVPGAPMDMPELDRLEHALFDTLDPSKEHLTSFLAGAGASAPAEAGSDPEQSKVTSASVTGDWSEGDRAGNVSLSVEDPTAGESGMSDPGAAPCEDPGLFSGPQLSCERRELADGTVVLVGTGSKNGFARITVHYVRPDGQLVWATSDQASGIWWEDSSGAGPLDGPPVTVDQLIDLAQDPRVHL